MAYNRYQYETSPRKLQPEYEPIIKKYPKKTKAKKSKVKTLKKQKIQSKRKIKIQIKIIGYLIIIFTILFAISYRNALIDKNFLEVKDLRNNLAAIQKENEQLEVSIENSLNLQTIEQSAKEMLGMQKLNNKQTIYINLPKQDYIEPATEEIIKEDNTNWFEKILNFIMGK